MIKESRSPLPVPVKMVTLETLVESRNLLSVWNYQWKLACWSTFLSYDSFSIRVIWTIGVREIIPHSHPLAVSAGVFERCSSTGSENFSLSIAFTWRYQFCTTYSVFTLLEAICSKNVEQNHSPNMEKVHLRLTCVPLKHLYLLFSLFSNVTFARRAL